MIWKQKISVESLNSRNEKTLCDHLGIYFTQIGDDYLIAAMPIHPYLLQPMGILHGGSSCAFAETIGSSAANYCVNPDQRCVGLCLNINYIRPVSSGVLTAKATPIHLGKKTQIWEIIMTNEQHKITSNSKLTLAIIDQA